MAAIREGHLTHAQGRVVHVGRWLKLLLIALPIAVVLRVVGNQPVWLFITSCVAIVPLAQVMGEATEELAKHMGQRIGGLLNATFGNATELIIALFAIRAGLFDVVKASITGSIVGNSLLVLGLALFVGGLRREKQQFTAATAQMNASLMILAVICVMVPAVFSHAHGGMSPSAAHHMSVAFSVTMIVVYLLGLLFSLHTHRALFETGAEREQAEWGRGKAMGVLAVATIGVALLSEFLVGSIEHVAEHAHLSRLFIGVVIIPIIGNAAEHAAAVSMAVKDKMDISFSIAVGSTTQIALFVAPFLLLAGHAMGLNMDLVFEPSELVAIGFCVAIVNTISQDGETNWFEGVLLLAAYVIVAVGFYFVP